MGRAAADENTNKFIFQTFQVIRELSDTIFTLLAILILTYTFPILILYAEVDIL